MMFYRDKKVPVTGGTGFCRTCLSLYGSGGDK